ncbi:MAG: RNA methyltransferase [Betaproteobacteria bacterium]|nr:RNA methyltransferase [Betaproteobacteria bacterium]
MNPVRHITARDNPLLKELRKLGSDSVAYRKLGRIWVEGEHLCSAALARGLTPRVAVFSDAGWERAAPELRAAALDTVRLSNALFGSISALDCPADMGFVMDVPLAAQMLPGVNTVVLDRVQDAGNVGSILRSASAFGVRQVLALRGTAALCSPKVLRAGMGAHFGLHLVEGLEPQDLDAWDVPLLVTSSHQGAVLHEALLPHPCAWVFGHEGQGVAPHWEARAALTIRIAQPGGEESLNVAAAAAICLHAASIAA